MLKTKSIATTAVRVMSGSCSFLGDDDVEQSAEVVVSGVVKGTVDGQVFGEAWGHGTRGGSHVETCATEG